MLRTDYNELEEQLQLTENALRIKEKEVIA